MDNAANEHGNDSGQGSSATPGSPQQPSESFYVKTSSGRYVGLYPAAEVQAALASGAFQPDWVAVGRGNSISNPDANTSSEVDWKPLGDLFGAAVAAAPPPTPPSAPPASAAVSPQVGRRQDSKTEAWSLEDAKRGRLKYWIFFGLFTVNLVAAIIYGVSAPNSKWIIRILAGLCILWFGLSLWNNLLLARRVLRYSIVRLIVFGILSLYPLFLVIVLMVNDQKIQKRMAARQLSDQLRAKTDADLVNMAANAKALNADQLTALKTEIARRGMSFDTPVISPQAPAQTVTTTSTPSSEAKPAQTVQFVWEVRSDANEVKTYPTQKEVEDAIMRDEIKPQWACRRIQAHSDAAKKTEPKWKPVEKMFALYRPIRAHMWKGAGIGAWIGVALWLGINAVGDLVVAARIGSSKALGLGLGTLFWFLLFLNGFVPTLSEKNRKTLAPLINGAFKLIIIGGILAAVNGGSDVLSGAFSAFSGIFAAFILGALLGGLPGSAVGTCVGLVRRRHLQMPPSGAREDVTRATIIGILLPIILFTSGAYLYVKFVFPWAQEAAIHALR